MKKAKVRLKRKNYAVQIWMVVVVFLALDFLFMRVLQVGAFFANPQEKEKFADQLRKIDVIRAQPSPGK